MPLLRPSRYNTFNEPKPGIVSGCAPMLEPCPTVEMGPLTDFHVCNVAAVRAVDSHYILFPEGVTQSGVLQPSLPDFGEPQLAYNAHIYCPGFIVDQDIPGACAAVEANGLANYLAYTRALDIPLVLTEFSSCPTPYQGGPPGTLQLELVSATPLRCGAVAMHYRRAR